VEEDKEEEEKEEEKEEKEEEEEEEEEEKEEEEEEEKEEEDEEKEEEAEEEEEEEEEVEKAPVLLSWRNRMIIVECSGRERERKGERGGESAGGGERRARVSELVAPAEYGGRPQYRRRVVYRRWRGLGGAKNKIIGCLTETLRKMIT
jgi:hypothetical protein